MPRSLRLQLFLRDFYAMMNLPEALIDKRDLLTETENGNWKLKTL